MGKDAKYEDLLDEFAPPRKPGYVSPREEKEKIRQAFAGQLIQALEFAEKARAARTPRQLAGDLYARLQYDFPSASSEELQALSAEVDAAARKGQACPFPPTAALVSNLAQAAKVKASAGAGSSSNGGTSSATVAAAAPPTASPADAPGAVLPVTAAFQAAAAAYCVRLLAHLLRLRPDVAAAQLARFNPPPMTAAAAAAAQPAPPEAAESAASVGPHGDYPEAGLAQHAQQQQPSGFFAAAAGLVVEETAEKKETRRRAEEEERAERYAAVQDDDDVEYEDMEEVSGPALDAVLGMGGLLVDRRSVPPTANGTSTSSGHGAAAAAGGEGSASGLLASKLVALGCAIDSQCLSADHAWREAGGLVEDIATCVSAAMAHEQCDRLEPLVAAHCTLAAVRMGESAPDLDRGLPAMWAALGLQRPGVGRGAGSAGDGHLARTSGELLAFTATLAGHARSTVCANKLCNQIHASLLPALGSSLNKLAAATSSSSGGGGGRRAGKAGKGDGTAGQGDGAASAGGAQGPQAEEDARRHQELMAACAVIEFYCLNSRTGAAAHSGLASSGVLRSLAVLFMQRALEHDAEPLRRALLLCAATSPESATWLGHVPGLVALLAGPVFQKYEVLEHHGAAWALLLGQGGKGSTAGQQAQGTGELVGPAERLDALMAYDADREVLQLSRCHRILALLADVRRAAGGRQLWGAQLQQQLQQMAASIRGSQQQQQQQEQQQQQQEEGQQQQQQPGVDSASLAPSTAAAGPAAASSRTAGSATAGARQAATAGEAADANGSDDSGGAAASSSGGVKELPAHLDSVPSAAAVKQRQGEQKGEQRQEEPEQQRGGAAVREKLMRWGADRDEKQRQLHGACLRLLKQLTVQERGKDD